MPTEGQNLDKIEKVLKDFTKRLPGMKEQNYWDIIKTLRMNSQQRRLERYQIIYMWKIMQGLVPNPGINWFQERESGRNGRVAKLPQLKGKASVKSLREQSFQVSGPRLFNCGPKDIRNMSKLKLDHFLTEVPDEPKGGGLVPGATNPFTGIPTNSLVQQVVRRVSSWNGYV